MVKKEVTIVVILRDYASATAKKISQSVKQINNSANQLQDIFKTMDSQVLANQSKQTQFWKNYGNVMEDMRFKGWGAVKVMRMTGEEFRSLDDGVGKLNKSYTKNMGFTGRLAANVRHLTTGFRGFRMEMLGVMFFGMMVQKFFQSLIQPSLQMTGAMELLSAVLGIMFLPLAMQVIHFAVWLLKKWMALDEGTQLLINKIVGLGIVIGAALYIIGSLALGIGSLLLVMGGFAGILVVVGLIVLALAALTGTTDLLKLGFHYLIEKINELWEKFLDNSAVQNFLTNIGLSKEQIESLKDPLDTLKTTFDTVWTKAKTSFDTWWTDFKEKNPKIAKVLEEFKKYFEDVGMWIIETFIPVYLSPFLAWFRDDLFPFLNDDLLPFIKGPLSDAFRSLVQLITGLPKDLQLIIAGGLIGGKFGGTTGALAGMTAMATLDTGVPQAILKTSSAYEEGGIKGAINNYFNISVDTVNNATPEQITTMVVDGVDRIFRVQGYGT